MNHQNAIIAMLAILSIAALVGVFTIQVADAQLPRLSVNTEGVGVQTEELFLDVGPETGVIAETEEFDLTATPQGSVSLIPTLSEE
jgi:hypothetical protein